MYIYMSIHIHIYLCVYINICMPKELPISFEVYLMYMTTKLQGGRMEPSYFVVLEASTAEIQDLGLFP